MGIVVPDPETQNSVFVWDSLRAFGFGTLPLPPKMAPLPLTSAPASHETRDAAASPSLAST